MQASLMLPKCKKYFFPGKVSGYLYDDFSFNLHNNIQHGISYVLMSLDLKLSANISLKGTLTASLCFEGFRLSSRKLSSNIILVES